MTDADRSRPADALRQQLDAWLEPILDQLSRAENDGQWLQVERLCKQALQRDAENWSLWQRLARSHESRAEWGQAETLWRHLTQRFSSRPEPYLALAALQRRRGAADSARVVLQEAERRVGSSEALRQALGVIDDPWALGENIPQLGLGASASEVGQALQLAQSHLDAGRFAEGEAVLEQILQARPRAGRIQLSLAKLRWRRQQTDAVISQLGPLLENSAEAEGLPERHALTLLLAEALLARQEWERTARVILMLEAEPLESRDTNLLLLMAQALIGRCDDAAALGLLQRCLQLDPAQSRAERLQGELLLRLGDWDGAIDALSRAVALQPGHQETLDLLEQARNQQLWWIGEQALRMGDWDGAALAYSQLLQRDGSHRQALGRLDLLASLEPGPLASGASGCEDRSPEGQLAAFVHCLDRAEAQLKRLGVLP